MPGCGAKRVIDPPATLRFLSWLRRGAATRIETPDSETGSSRLSMPVTVTFEGPGLSVTTSIDLLGPADIVGFDPRSITRVVPPPGTLDAEVNYFPAVELDQPDLPWRYTPRRHDGAGRLRPWLCLLTLAEGELGEIKPAGADRPLETITLPEGTAMPSPDQLWAWAHVQVSGDDGVPLHEIVRTQQRRVLARLLSPRRLVARTKYWGVVVPAFEVGRLAGLRLPLGDATNDLAPAWRETTLVTELELPIYYRWTFTTGDAGDFESLALRLKPAVLPPTSGTRGLDVREPGGGLDAAAETPLPLGGALRPLHAPTPQPLEPGFVRGMRDLVNRPAEVRSQVGGTPLVAPPLYGMWPARRDHLDATPPPGWLETTPPSGWLDQLNLDPRARVVAGVATEVVQAEQEALMASAWEQVAGVREANAQLAMAQLARAVGERLHRRYLAATDDDAVLVLTAPVQSQVRARARGPEPLPWPFAGGGTVVAQGGAGAQGAATPPPITGGGGSVVTAGATGGHGAAAAPSLPAALIAGQGTVAGTKGTRPPRADLPPTVVPPENQNVTTQPGPGRQAATAPTVSPNAVSQTTGAARTVRALVDASPPRFALFSGAMRRLTRPRGPLGRRQRRADRPSVGAATLVNRDPALLSPPPPPIDSFLPSVRWIERMTQQQLFDVEAIRSASIPAGASARDPADDEVAQPATGADNSMALFRTAAVEYLRNRPVPAKGPIEHRLDLPALRAAVVAAVDPRTAIPAAFAARKRAAPGFNWQPADPLEPVMAHPTFPQPMYLPLSKRSPDWILPGLFELPVDRVVLAHTDQAFIEAYMVGLNHELARELLWREYPTDQRGTCFRQFWDPAGAEPPHDPERARDVTPINSWERGSALGNHSPRLPPAAGANLVLVIRAELLRRYPSTVVYAQRATAGLELDEERRRPAFTARIAPDVVILGFALTEGDLRTPPGWFFVFEEQPGEPRFGLDVNLVRDSIKEWDELSWLNLEPGQRYIDLASPLPATAEPEAHGDWGWHVASGTNGPVARGADHAAITLRRPARVAIYGVDLLLPPPPQPPSDE